MRRKSDGLKQRLVFLEPKDPEAWPIGGEPILRAGRAVGQVTSCAYGYSVGHVVAMGYVELLPDGLAAALGDETHALDIAGEIVLCDLSTRAPYDPECKALRG